MHLKRTQVIWVVKCSAASDQQSHAATLLVLCKSSIYITYHPLSLWVHCVKGHFRSSHYLELRTIRIELETSTALHRVT